MSIEYNTAVMFGMTCAIIALVIILAYLADEVIRLRNERSLDVEADHTECAVALSAYMGDAVFAERLRTLAERYDSDAGIREMTYLRRELEKQRATGGPTLPALWMQLQADRMSPAIPEPSDGDQILFDIFAKRGLVMGRDELDRPVRAGDGA